MCTNKSMQPPCKKQIEQHVRHLLTAPAISALLGAIISLKFFILALIYLVVAAKPLLHCYQLQFKPNGVGGGGTKTTTTEEACDNSTTGTKSGLSPPLSKMVHSTLMTHRSLTFQFTLLGICLLMYEQSRKIIAVKKQSGDSSLQHTAFWNAWKIIEIEHNIHTDFEPALQNAFIWMSPVGNVYYGLMHFVAPTVIMGRLIIKNQDPKFRYRLSFFLMLFIGLIIFTLLPTMPPRLLNKYYNDHIVNDNSIVSGVGGLSRLDITRTKEMMKPFWNITDTMVKEDTIYNEGLKKVGNPYAAMPSMHTGWALWSALVGVQACGDKSTTRHIWVYLGVIHVVLTVFFIIITGNHFWLDAVGGAVCTHIGLLLAKWLTMEVFTSKVMFLAKTLLGKTPPFVQNWFRSRKGYAFTAVSTLEEDKEEVPV